jgi:DNA-binding PadR family transcriptional regulator
MTMEDEITMANVENNSEQRDSMPQEIRPLDMFLLGLVRGGLITPYDWQSRARTSLGASLPAVRRLEKAGLLEKARKGPRGRQEFALTQRGRDQVANLGPYVQHALNGQLGDLESVVRLACLATVVRKTKTAKELLLEAAHVHKQRARAAKKQAASVVAPRSGLGGLYSKALAHCEVNQEFAIANSLDWLARHWETLSQETIQRWRNARGTRG